MELRKVRLGDVASFVMDKVRSDDITLSEYVTTDSLLQNKTGRTVAQNLPPQPCSLTRYKSGDVLIGNIRPYLKKIWLADGGGGCSNDVLAFRAKEGFSSSFLYAILSQDTFFDYLMLAAKGSKMPRGDKDHAMRFKVPSIPIEQQRRIGKLLSDIDRKIALNRRMNAKLEAMARQLYDYWFLQFDFPDAHGKPYKSSGGKMTWNNKLKRDIPEGWEVMPIGEILDKYPSTKRYETKDYLPVGRYPIVDQGDAFIVGYTNEEENLLRRHPAVLFGDHSTKVKYLDFDFARGADGTQVLYSSHSAICQYYLYLAVSSMQIPNPGYSRHFKYLKDMPITVPDMRTASEFERIILPISKEWTKNIFCNISLTRLRTTLLPLLMNGQVSVEEPQ